MQNVSGKNLLAMGSHCFKPHFLYILISESEMSKSPFLLAKLNSGLFNFLVLTLPFSKGNSPKFEGPPASMRISCSVTFKFLLVSSILFLTIPSTCPITFQFSTANLGLEADYHLPDTLSEGE